MADLRSISAAAVQDQDLSLHEVLYTLKLKGQLRPLVEEAIVQRLIAAEAQKQGLIVSDDEKQKAADLYRRGLGLEKAETTEQWLKLNHLSPEDMEIGLTRALLQQKLIDAIPGQAVQEYFAANRAGFDRARLARIVVAKKDLAEELLTQIKEEVQDFAALAQKHSTDLETKEGGGRMGVLPRRRLPPAIAQAVFNARAGDLLGPFEVNGSYALVKVEGLLPARLTPRLAEFIRLRLFRDWLRRQVQAVNIQLKLHEHLA
jgi:peptidylprolyl isomerase